MRVELNQKIYTTKMNTEVSFAPTNTYKPKLIKRFQWLANLSWWVINKLQASEHHLETIKKYTYNKIDQQNLFESFRSTIDNLYARGENPYDYVFVIGVNQFREITGDQEMYLSGVVSFDLQFNHHSSSLQRGTVYGINTYVVHAIDGIAVLPKQIIEVKVQKMPTNDVENADYDTSAVVRFEIDRILDALEKTDGDSEDITTYVKEVVGLREELTTLRKQIDIIKRT